MEPVQFLQTSAVLLGLSALGGAAMALIRFSGKPHPPAWLAMLHGFLAAAGLTLLAFAAATVGVPQLAVIALVLFIAAAGGGVLLNLGYHLKGVPLPKWLVLVHAAIAIVGFACLLIAAFA